MFDKRLFMHFDLFLFIIVFLLAAIGVVNIYSATIGTDSQIYQKQIYWLMIGVSFMVLFLFVDYSRLEVISYVIYGAIIILLIVVVVIGHSSSGAQRWLNLGFISFQPSEFSKIALIVALSKYFSKKQIPPKGLNAKRLLIPVALLVIPFLLIARQPDLGTAMVLGLIFSSMVLFVKIRTKTLVVISGILASIVPLTWYYLKDYQKARLLSFLKPTQDPLGMGYHLIQSKIAIGSGGLLGEGFLSGTQGRLLFLPERHTDFVFSILAEEWGFIGSFCVTGLFLILIILGLNTVKYAKDKFGSLLAFGVTSMFFWHVVINIGMVTGMLPVVGAPLPFFSYGGSFLVTVIFGVGILLNVNMRRFILR
jgi:rod shape determining protein RodA